MSSDTLVPIRTVRAFEAGGGIKATLRRGLRAAAISGLSLTRAPTKTQGWIRFPYYHHVFDDERAGFQRQLRYYKSIADIISLDDAVTMMASGDAINGRYICITFDDGFKNWIENALPILVEQGATAAFFVASDYINTDLDRDRDKLLAFYDDGTRLMEFLSWADCRTMIDVGMTIGSHSCGHVHLNDLDQATAAQELQRSKAVVEENTAHPCHHFCCPFGRAGMDYDPMVHPKMAGDVGYRSFLTGHRGKNRAGDSPFDIKRDHVLANWSDYQLRYFMGS